MPSAGDPVRATDITNIEQYTTSKPLIKLVQQSAQSCASGSTSTLTFGAGSEEIETHNYHDTAVNNTRVTPLLAGYYRVDVGVTFASSSTTQTVLAQVAKNGALVSPSSRIRHLSVGFTPSSFTSALVSLNGTTDYVEAIAIQTDSGAAARLTSVATGLACTLTVEFVRPL